MSTGLLEAPVGLVDPACPVEWAHPLNRGLVAWWGAVPNPGWRYSRVYRSVAVGKQLYHGTLGSGVTWKPNALTLSSSNVVDCGTGINTKMSGAKLSFSCWVNLTGSGARTIFRNDNGGGGSGTGFNLRISSGAAIQMEVYPSINATTGTTTLSNGIWYHVAGVYNGGTSIAVYVNGKREALNTSSIQASVAVGGGRFYIGTWGGGEWFTGDIRNPLCFNRALSDAEIFALYQEQRRGNPETLRWISTRAYSFPQAAGLTRTMGNYRFRNDDGSETTATWKAAENANASQAVETPVRLRIQTDVSGDPPSEAVKMQYRKVGDPTWLNVT